MTRSFFTGCFWFWKSWLRTSTFLAFSFLIFASSCVRVVLFIICTLFWMIGTEFTFRKVVLTFRRNFLAFFILGPPNTIFFWPPFRVLCLFFAKVCFTSSLNPPLPLPFSFAFSSFSFATFELTGLPTMLVVVPCPKTRSFIINIALLTSYFVSSPLSILIFRIVFDDEGSVCTAVVSAHEERRILHVAFRRTE